jgi:hypothetical protein
VSAAYGRRRTDLREVESAEGAAVAEFPPRVHLRAHPFEEYIAYAAILRALAFFYDPTSLARSPIGHALHPYDQVWNTLSLAGGVLVIAGLLMDHRIYWRVQGIAVESCGLVFLATSVIVNVLAIISEVGFTRGGILTSLVLLLVLRPLWRRAMALRNQPRLHIPVPVHVPQSVHDAFRRSRRRA